jgi:anaphase-promoting complex subunit 6
VEAWIAFGASFAACDESDQALASFRAAQRLAPGDATSLLYIGMKYLRTNHTSLAEHFLWAAHQASRGTNKLCCNELGVWALGEKNYEQAAKWFVRTLTVNSSSMETAQQVLENHQAFQEVLAFQEVMDSVQDKYWEPTVLNLAHALRKLRQWDLAAFCLERCLTLQPTNPSAWTALGYCYHLSGKLDQAIDTYHQALAQKPEDPFASEMLQRALQDALEQTTELFENIGIGGGANNGEAATSSKLAGHAAAATTSQLSAAKAPHADQSSFMTDDGLSLSAETAGDVDMG